jgi:hypothetical protein
MAKLYGAWKVTLPGETFTWEPDEMLGSEWGELAQRLGGMSFEDWVDGIDQRDFGPCRALIWFLRRRKGIDLDLADVDFKIRQMDTEKIPDPEDEAATSTSVAAISEPSPDGAGVLVTLTP